jgi:hypothetical protein
MISTAPVEGAPLYRARSGSKETVGRACFFSLLRIRIQNAANDEL